MEKEEKITIRLTEALRRTLQREADEAGIKLSEHIRRLLLVTHPHIAAFDDVARIEASARKAGAKASEGVPYLMSVLRRLEEGLQALQGLEALTTQWREAAARELQVAIADVNEHIWGPVEQDEQTLSEHPLEQFPIKCTGSASVSFGAATCQLHAPYMRVKTALVVSARLLSQMHPARRCRGQCCGRWPRCVACAYWMALAITLCPFPVERGPTAWVIGLYTTHSTVHLVSGRIRAAMTLLQM